MKKYNKNGYSIIIALLLVGFLLILTVGVLNLVLRELNSNKSMGDYIKASAGAQAGQELALLEIKQKGYSYYNKIDNNTGFLDKISVDYDIGSKTNSYTGELKELGYDIIPLFYTTGSLIENKATGIKLNVFSGSESDLSWNIVSENSGISGTGNIINTTNGYLRTYTGNTLSYSSTGVSNLNSNSGNYLILFNSNTGSQLNYNLSSPSDFFTKPKTQIISSAKVGEVKQNIITDFDNNAYLNILKYSIYSN